MFNEAILARNSRGGRIGVKRPRRASLSRRSTRWCRRASSSAWTRRSSWTTGLQRFCVARATKSLSSVAVCFEDVGDGAGAEGVAIEGAVEGGPEPLPNKRKGRQKRATFSCRYNWLRKLATSGTTVPVPDHAELKIGTLTSIIRQSGVARSLFE